LEARGAPERQRLGRGQANRRSSGGAMDTPKTGSRGMMLRTLALLAAVLLPCSASAADVAYYDLPAGAFPHDVAPAADGSVWYTDQHQGRLGKLDPHTGKIE